METKVKKKTQGATIYDVAEEAGVSLATVSRVINNSAVVRPERRERVQAAIRRLNFKPNEIARGLARQKSTTLGVLVPDMGRAEANDLLAGIVDTANLKKYGYAININSYLGDFDSFKVQVDKMVSSQLDGLLIMADYLTDAMHAELIHLSIPIVLFATPTKVKDLPSVSLNYEKVGSEIADYIIEQKYKSATILMRESEQCECGLVGTFTQCCTTRDIVLTQQLMKSDANYTKAYNALYEIYQKEPFPQVVFATNNTFALAFSNVAQDLGKKIPDDIEIISFSNTQLALVGRPKITSVMYPVYRIGAYAMSMVTKLINDEPLHDILSLQNEYEIIWRESTKRQIK